MATYDSLTQDQKDDIQGLLLIVRPAQGDILRLARALQPVMSLWNGGVSSLVSSLEVAENIPNTTSLVGADSVTRENLLNNLMAYVTAVAALSTQAHVDNMTPAAGAPNL